MTGAMDQESDPGVRRRARLPASLVRSTQLLGLLWLLNQLESSSEVQGVQGEVVCHAAEGHGGDFSEIS